MTAPVNKENIIVGAGTLACDPAGGTNYSNVGGTDDGVEFASSKDFHDVQAAEAPVTLKKELTNMTGTISTSLIEATLDNLLISWEGEISGDTLTVATVGNVSEQSLQFTGEAPAGATRTYTFPKVVSIGEGGHQYTKGSNTLIEVEFEVLPEWNDTESRWEFFTIVDA